MDNTIAEVKIVETEKGYRIEVEGEKAKEWLKSWMESKMGCTCCE